MPVMPGIYKDSEIQSHTIKATFGGKEFVELQCSIKGESVPVLIWLTPKSTTIARISLAKCGFNVDNQELTDLIQCPELLKGNRIEIDVEDSQYGTQGSIVLTKVTTEQVNKIAERLRGAKGAELAAPKPPEDDDIPF